MQQGTKTWRQQINGGRNINSEDTYNVQNVIAEKSVNCLFPQLIGYDDQFTDEERTVTDWQVIEIKNLVTLMKSTDNIRFFRIVIDKEIVLESLAGNGLLHIPYDIFLSLKKCPENYSKYLLLEESSELHWRSKQLVGIAKVCDLSPSFEKNHIRVAYLCLSKTEIDLYNCDDYTLSGIATILKSYVNMLKLKSLEPLLPSIKPWCPVKAVSRSNSYEQSVSTTDEHGETTSFASMQKTVDNINKTIASKWHANSQKNPIGESRNRQNWNINSVNGNHLDTAIAKPGKRNPIEARSNHLKSQLNATGCENQIKSAPLVENGDQKSNGNHCESVLDVIDLTQDRNGIDEEGCKNLVPPLQGLLKPDKSLNTETWQTIEYDNLTQISDLTGKRFFMCDLELKDIYSSFGNGGLLSINQILYDEIPDMQPNPAYLVLRKKDSGKFKAVIGLAKVGFKMKNSVEIQVVYVCLSRAYYVLNPWCDELFADGQEISCLEDVQILLAEYKMSARHKKVNPVFDHIFPWSGTPPVMNPTTSSSDTFSLSANGLNLSNGRISSSSMNLGSPSVTSATYLSTMNNGCTTMKNVNQGDKKCFENSMNYDIHLANDASNVVLSQKDTSKTTDINGGTSSQERPANRGRFQYNSPVNRKTNNSQDGCITSPTKKGGNQVNVGLNVNRNANGTDKKPLSILNNVVKNIESIPSNESNWVESYDMNASAVDKNTTNTSSEERFKDLVNSCLVEIVSDIETDEENTNHKSSSPKKQVSPAKAVVTKPPDKNKLAPLRGLFVTGTKALSTQIWEEIERNNLAYIFETGNNEFYLCNTDISSIRKSLKEHYLDISFRNMENIASLGRARKMLILRAPLPHMCKLVVVGIAMVNTSACIEHESKNGRFSVKVTYLCLSLPTFPGSYFAPSLSDGVEVFSHISGSFIQQYMLTLRQRTIKPLFPEIYPWSSVLPSKYESVGTSTTPKKVVIEPRSPIAINSKIDRQHDSYADDIFAEVQGDYADRTISFQQIGCEIAQYNERAHVGNERTSTKHSSTVSPMSGKTLKETIECRMQQYSAEVSRMLSSNTSCRRVGNDHFSRSSSDIFDVRQKPVEGVKKNPCARAGRGRGRGMLLFQHANATTNTKI